jgi:glycosyltransferase involved in cell wall biosynthesis
MLISIIIPVRNVAGHLGACLEQLRRQDYPHEKLEVLLVDGASTDHTADLAESFDLGDIPLQVLRLSETGRSRGLNAGIRAARGEVICRLDVRTRIEPDYIRRCQEILVRTGAANVGGIQTPHGRTVTQRAIGLAMAHPFGVGNAQFRIGKQSGFVDTVYPGFFRRDVFHKVGFFDENPGVVSEDSDLNQRIRAGGDRIYLDVGICAGYEPRASIKQQGRLYFRYGVARSGNLRKHRSFTSWRQLAAPALVAILLGLPVLAVFLPAAWLVWAGIAAAYLCADAAFAIHVSARHRCLRAFPALLLVFPAMHFGWGLGFWSGLLLPSKPDEHLSV